MTTRRKKKRGPAVAFVSKSRVRRFIAEEKLMPLRRVMPNGFWQKLDDAVQTAARAELSRGQIALPL